MKQVCCKHFQVKKTKKVYFWGFLSPFGDKWGQDVDFCIKFMSIWGHLGTSVSFLGHLGTFTAPQYDLEITNS
jgi:hypothetical protein